MDRIDRTYVMVPLPSGIRVKRVGEVTSYDSTGVKDGPNLIFKHDLTEMNADSRTYPIYECMYIRGEKNGNEISCDVYGNILIACKWDHGRRHGEFYAKVAQSNLHWDQSENETKTPLYLQCQYIDDLLIENQEISEYDFLIATTGITRIDWKKLI